MLLGATQGKQRKHDTSKCSSINEQDTYIEVRYLMSYNKGKYQLLTKELNNVFHWVQNILSMSTSNVL